LAKDICTKTNHCFTSTPSPRLVGALGDELLFLASDSAHGRDFWLSNGTAGGTHRLTDMPGTTAHPGGDFWIDQVASGGRFFFTGTDGHGTELWIVENGRTHLITDIARREPSSRARDFATLGNELFFTACDGQTRRTWISSGTTESTAALPAHFTRDCVFSSSDHSELAPMSVADRIFYLDQDQLWSTDGTAGGAVQLTQLSSPRFLGSRVAFQGMLYFEVSAGDHVEIWRTNGTLPGTVKAFDLPVSWTYGLHALGAELYFSAASDNSVNVWRSDGTQAGTRKLTQGVPISDQPLFTRVGSSVFFITHPVFAVELWKTDGTIPGTVKVRDLFGDQYSHPVELREHQGRLYFFAPNEVEFDTSWSLWRSDGTGPGTVPVHAFEIVFSTLELPVFNLTSLADRLYFVANDGASGIELWTSDGTSHGTLLVRDLMPGPESSSPSSLTAAGGKLFFAANDGEHGNELWQTDGTAEGTKLVQDLAPEDVSSHPGNFTATPTHLYFLADDGASGRELWSLPLTGSGCQPSPRHLCLGGGRFRVEASWKDFQGNVGVGTAVAVTSDTGYFWFFNAANVEVVLKVLDGTGVNGHRWVFYGALSSVEYTLTVTDTQTGLSRRYYNPPGQLASVGDTTSFGPLGAFSKAPGKASVAAPSPIVLASESTDPAAATGSCQATAEQLCLSGQRFAVEIAWKDFQGNTGKGKAVSLTGDTGYFWFFDAANVEVVLKVLDGTPLNGKHWVFYGALSSVEYTITVTDTQTGTKRTYENASGRLASVADTGAF
jgi:ELWxxDGT repeat protein